MLFVAGECEQRRVWSSATTREVAYSIVLKGDNINVQDNIIDTQVDTRSDEVNE